MPHTAHRAWRRRWPLGYRYHVRLAAELDPLSVPQARFLESSGDVPDLAFAHLQPRTIVDTRWLTTQPEEHGDTNRQPMREDGLGTGMGWAACRLGSKDGRRGVMWREGCIQARCLR